MKQFPSYFTQKKSSSSGESSVCTTATDRWDSQFGPKIMGSRRGQFVRELIVQSGLGKFHRNSSPVTSKLHRLWTTAFLLLATQSTTCLALEYASSGEVALSTLGLRGEIFAVVQADSPYSPRLSLAITENPRGLINFSLGNIQLKHKGLALNLGKIPVPLGLQPPIFASRAPLPSRADVYPELFRSALAVLARPAFGAGAAYAAGNFQVYGNVYEAQKSSVAQQLFVAGLITPVSDAVDPRDVVCMAPICDQVRQISRDLFSGEIPVRRVVQTVRDLALTVEQDSTQLIGLKSPVYQVGGLYSDGAWRISTDAVLSKLAGESITAAAVAVEYSTDRAQIALQPLFFGNTYGALLSVTTPWYYAQPYARVGIYSGSNKGVEAALGVNVIYGPLASRVGYSFLSLRSASQGQYTAGISWSWGR